MSEKSSGINIPLLKRRIVMRTIFLIELYCAIASLHRELEGGVDG